MSDDLDALAARHPQWKFSRVPAGHIVPSTGEDGFYARKRDRPDAELFSMTASGLESLIIAWREPED